MEQFSTGTAAQQSARLACSLSQGKYLHKKNTNPSGARYTHSITCCESGATTPRVRWGNYILTGRREHAATLWAPGLIVE